MRQRPLSTSILVVLCLLGLSLSFACKDKSTTEPGATWLGALYDQGQGIFYQTIRDKIAAHPMRASLTEVELQKIRESETRYPRLYGILVNVFYQKDEPTFTLLLDKADKKSRRRFSGMYLDLARFAGDMFVETFFATDTSTGLVRKINPSFKDLDAVDIVVRSVGYGAKLDAPRPGSSSATRSARNSSARVRLTARASGRRMPSPAEKGPRSPSSIRGSTRVTPSSRRQSGERTFPWSAARANLGRPTPRWSIGAGTAP